MSKRKRPETGPTLLDSERVILNAIKARRDSGIWSRHIKEETKIADSTVTKSVKSLLAKNLIKEVVNIQNKSKKHYMAIEFQPSKEMTGGDWYNDGNLDKELINQLKRVSMQYLRTQKVATLEDIHKFFQKKNVFKFEISSHQISEILNSMVLDSDIIEVKSTGLGDYHSIPIGATCYRIASGLAARGLKVGAFASIPCGVCPSIGLCTPDGTISPSTCVYFTNWLDLDI